MIELTFPMPPNRGNARGHWAVAHRLKKDYVRHCVVPIYEALGPLAPNNLATFEKIKVSATFYCWALSDEDNLTARLKWPLDALVEYRVVKDDSPAHVTLGEVTQEIDRKNQRLVLRIEEAR